MTFTGIIDRQTTVVIDGYSNRKTEVTAIREFGRWIAKNVNKEEGESIVEYGLDSLVSAKDSCGGYFLEIEEVPCACEWDEEADEMKYKEGKYYLCCRIVK